MAVSSRKEIRDSVLSTTRQTNEQIGSLVNDFINLTLNEINDPGWAFTRNNYSHMWSWLRGKTTFTTVASTEDYVMKREIDRIALIRQTTSPIKLVQIPDELFFQLVPNPTQSGNPRFYRLWENEGVSTRLSSAGTIDVLSSSASDAGSSELSVTVVGYSSGILTSETYQLNGVTAVAGTISFDAREIYVSKQKATTGTVTVIRNSDSSTLVTIGKEERAPKFKVITLYPKPSSAITMYVEYYTRIRELTNDSDVPQFDQKWHWVVRLGALAKTFQYLNKDNDFIATQGLFAAGVRSMVSSDLTVPDLIEQIQRNVSSVGIHQIRSEDAVA